VAAGEGWRVSIAEIHDATPFSTFPGARRLQMPLSPGGLVLSIAGRRHDCPAGTVCAFGGEDAVHPVGVTAPVRVLNLIWQPEQVQAALEATSVDGALTLGAPGAATIAVLIGGAEDESVTAAGTPLRPLDALGLDPGETVALHGRGRIARAVLAITDVRQSPRPRSSPPGPPRHG
jgi:uncharacterized protein